MKNFIFTILLLTLSVTAVAQQAFITTWKTTTPNEEITIPILVEDGDTYTINWGDNTPSSTHVTSYASHEYQTPGTYTVSIIGDFIGDFRRIYFNNSGDKDKIREVNQWGDIEWTSMSNAFWGCSNLRITATDAPDLTQVDNMTSMFAGCTALDFNEAMNDWDVSKVERMSWVFQGASAFNQDIGNWNVSRVINMYGMFSGAGAFNQDIGGWDLSSVTNIAWMLHDSGLDCNNYSATLIGWANNPNTSTGITLGTGGLTYGSHAQPARALLTTAVNQGGRGWNISGDAPGDAACNKKPFITTWETTSNNETITIPTVGRGYFYTVDWGDGTPAEFFIGTGTAASATHEYAMSGEHIVSITGGFPRIYFNNSGDKDKIREVNQWGDIRWKSMGSAFRGCSNLRITATDVPDLSEVEDMYSMFKECTVLNDPLVNWDVSHVTNMSQMFAEASAFNQDLSSWGEKVSSVTDMSSMFKEASNFNQDITNWNVSSVTNMLAMFNLAGKFNQDISGWNISNVTNMLGMFLGASTFNQDLSNWDVSKIASMLGMFDNSGLDCINYSATLNGWATHTTATGVTLGADGLKYGSHAQAARTELVNRGWNIDGDTPGTGTEDCNPFPSGFITTWEIPANDLEITIPILVEEGHEYTIDWGDNTPPSTHVTSYASHTYQAPGTYMVSLVGDPLRIYFFSHIDKDKIHTVEQWGDIQWTSMHAAFYGCSNLRINAEDTPDLGAVTDMSVMFRDALAFNQDMGGWDISNVTNMQGMLDNSGMDCINYSATLIGWANNPNTSTGITLGADGLTYGSHATGAREALTTSVDLGGLGWTIGEDELGTGEGDCSPDFTNGFITTWETDNYSPSSTNYQITIPTSTDEIYHYYVHWENTENVLSNGVAGPFQGDATITFPAVGTYRVSIAGDFPRIYFNNVGDRYKLLTVEQWGNIRWKSMNKAFYGCQNLTINTTDETDAPDLGAVTDMSLMFSWCTMLNDPLNHWDVSNVTNMDQMFNRATDFNQDIGNWKVSRVKDMYRMFYQASKFNQDIGRWEVDSVTNMEQMFGLASAFNGNIGGWNVSSVTNMSGMFQYTGAFNQDLGSWDLRSVTTMENMLNGSGLDCINYSANLTGWANNPDTPHNITLGADGLEYGTNAAEAVAELTGIVRNWNIIGHTLSGDQCSLFELEAIADAIINENTPYTRPIPPISSGTPVGTVTYTLGGADAGRFTINSSTEVLSMEARDYENPVDQNANNTYEISITATDENGNFHTEDWIVTIEDVSFTIEEIENVEVEENTVYTGPTPSLSGDTSLGTVTYTLGGADATAFTISDNTGVVSMEARDFESPADADSDNTYEVSVTAAYGNNSDTEDLTVTVEDTPFTIQEIDDATVEENTAYTGPTPSLSGDTSLGTITYTLIGADATAFTISDNTGVVSMVARDFESPTDADNDNTYEVSVTATYGDNSDTVNWTVTVQDVSLTIEEIGDATVEENAVYTGPTPSLSGDTSLGTVTYTLGGADATAFTISDNTGVVSMEAKDFESPADADSDNIYEVSVIATDGDNSYTVNWTVTVQDVSFTIKEIADATVYENRGYTSVSPLLSGDTPIGNVTYTLEGADAGLFNIDPSSGVVTMDTKDFESPADANTDNVYELIITATDEDGNTDSESLTVTVQDITTEIQFAIHAIANATISENRVYNGPTPSPAGDTPIGNITYTLAGADAPAFAIDEQTGVVTLDAKDFEVPADANTDNVYEVTIIATDEIGNRAGISWTVTVEDIKETIAFTINAIADDLVSENTPYTGPTPALSGDAPIGYVSYSLGGTDVAAFTIDEISGVVSMIAGDFENPVDANQDNIYEVRITAEDQDDNSASEDWTVTVQDVMEAVNFTIDAIDNATIDENTIYTGPTPSLSGENPIGQVTYTLEGDDAVAFTIDEQTGVVTMEGGDFESPTDTNADNVYEVTITSTDEDSNSASQSWTVTIGDVNENVLGLNEVERDLSLYPNPGQGSFQIDYQGEILEVVCYDFSGRVVKKIQGDRQTYPMNDLPAGLYTVRVQLGTGDMKFFKWLNQ